MISDNKPAGSYREEVGPADQVMSSRRRLLKGTALTAPALLTLPSFSVAALSNQLNTQLEQGLTRTQADTILASPTGPSYLQVQRATYLATPTSGSAVNIVNVSVSSMPVCPGDGSDPQTQAKWVDVDTLGDVPSGGKVFTVEAGDCSGGLLNVGAQITDQNSMTYTVSATSGTTQLLVLLDPVDPANSAVVAVGASPNQLNLSFASSWNSVGGTVNLPFGVNV